MKRSPLRKVSERKEGEKRMWNSTFKRKDSKLKHRSPSKLEQWKKYLRLLTPFIKAHPLCVIKSHVCTRNTKCVHHGKGRGIWLCVVEHWFPACLSCNGYLETADGKKWGYIKGFRL